MSHRHNGGTERAARPSHGRSVPPMSEAVSGGAPPAAAASSSTAGLQGNSASAAASSPNTFFMCPKRRYVRQVRIGKGATKEVFRAMDEDEGIEVAWNEIDFSQCISRSKVLHEVELLKKLHHPNIIRCFDSWEDPQRPCLVFVTELLTSGTLADFVHQQSRNALNRHAVVRYGRQILRGLAYLHSKDVIHRDLKCSNIFINGNKGEVKIGDLGVSIAGRSASTVIGTPEYMAPEMFQENYTNAVDIWSFGLCLLEMISGKRPYSECDHIGQIYKKLSVGILPTLDEIEESDVLEVIRRCLAIDPKDRPTAEALLQHPLFVEDISCANSAAGSSGVDNESFVGGLPAATRDLSVGDRLLVIDWLRMAPPAVRSDAIHFAVSRLWIDQKDADSIAMSSTAVRPLSLLAFPSESSAAQANPSSVAAFSRSQSANSAQPPIITVQFDPFHDEGPLDGTNALLFSSEASGQRSSTASPLPGIPMVTSFTTANGNTPLSLQFTRPPLAPVLISPIPVLSPESCEAQGGDRAAKQYSATTSLDADDDGVTSCGVPTPKHLSSSTSNGKDKPPSMAPAYFSPLLFADDSTPSSATSVADADARKRKAAQSEQKLLAQLGQMFLPHCSSQPNVRTHQDPVVLLSDEPLAATWASARSGMTSPTQHGDPS